MKFYIWLILIVVLAGCSGTSDCLKNGGEVIRKEFTFNKEIKTLILENEVNVYLKNGDQQKLDVEFPEQFMEHLDFNIEDGELRINNSLPCKWGRSNYAPQIYATLPALKYLRVFDFANVRTIDTLKQDRLKIYAYATGDIDLVVDMKTLRVQNDYVTDYTIAGNVDYFITYFKQYGRLFAENLMAERIKFTHTGDNAIHLYPLNRIDGSLTGFGNVYLYNVPDTMNIESKAEGKVIVEN